MQPLRAVTVKPSSVVKRRKHFLRKRRYAKQFFDADLNRIGYQLLTCQETEILAGCTSCGKSWWVLNKCRTRVCPLCSYEVSQQRAEYIRAMTKNMDHPKLLTLTMPLWQHDPHDGIKFLRDNFNRLRRHTIFEKVVGGAYTIELKQKDEGWHIHMHVLLDCPYIPYQKLFSAWKTLIGEQCPQVDIRSASDPKAREYVAKYAAKSAAFDTNPTSIVAWYNATKGERLWATFGKWYNATLEELDPDKPLPEHKPQCPHCGAEHTTFMARDGPYIFGHDEWRDLESAFTEDGQIERDIDVVKFYIDHKEFDEEILEENKCKTHTASQSTHTTNPTHSRQPSPIN